MRISERATQLILLTGSVLLLSGAMILRATGEGFTKPGAILLILWAVLTMSRAIYGLWKLNQAKRTEINTTDIK